MVSKVIWSACALNDLHSITAFIAQGSSLAAERAGTVLIEAAQSLGILPNRGRMIPERQRPDLRELICSPYRVAYRVEPGIVIILRIWHGARGEIQLPTSDE